MLIVGIVPGKLREELLDFQVHYQSQKELEENYEQMIDFIAHKIVALVMGNVVKLPDLSQILKTLINPMINLPESITDSAILRSALVGALKKGCPYWYDEGTSIFNAIDHIEDAIEHDSTSGDHPQIDIDVNNHQSEKIVSHNIHTGMFPKADIIREMKEKISLHQDFVDTFFDEHVVGYHTKLSIAYIYFNPQKMDKKALCLVSARAASSISRMKSKQYTVELQLDVHKCRELLHIHRNGDTEQREDADIDRKFTKAELDSYRRDQISSNEDLFTEYAKEDNQPHDLNSQSIVTGNNLTVPLESDSPICNVCPMLVSNLHSEPEQLQEQQKSFLKQVSCSET